MSVGSAKRTEAVPKPELSLFDSTCIIVGVIIGSGIYETSPKIAAAASGIAQQLQEFWPWLGRLVAEQGWAAWLICDASLIIGVWLLGGLLSLIGALCYAELANAYPKSGGDYVYITKGFGREMGFLFAWAQLWVVRPASIGMYAYIFARYANRICPLPEQWNPFMIYAAGAILVLTLINMLGVMMGKWTQNVLTVLKVIGLVAIVVVGLWASPSNALPEEPVGPWCNLGLAMILVFYTYGGWNEMAYVAAEVRNPRKNILRALVLGTVAVAAIYALVNLAFIRALGVVNFRSSQAVAADVLDLVVRPWGGKIISILICISTFGAINGMIFTGARIYYAMGTDHRMYRWLGSWDPQRGVPIVSLIAQGVVTLLMVIGFGWQASLPAAEEKPEQTAAVVAPALDAPAAQPEAANPKQQVANPSPQTKPNSQQAPVETEQQRFHGEKAFDNLLAFSAPIFWFFFLLVGLSLFALRALAGVEAGASGGSQTDLFRVPLYPIIPVVFCLSCLFMLYSSISYAISQLSAYALWALGIMVLGLLLAWISQWTPAKPHRPSSTV
ncbi:MAG: amino acid permease [Thermoguttaceae bacterium]|nr:amino acid permease [Thermoguttaceae bacterium]MDW8038124.1 amino acid permease [Thermoguttaceae bacterium]